MPEGPSIIILKELVQPFKRKKVIKASGTTTIDKKELTMVSIRDFKSWGKHFLICFPSFTLRIHFLLFGSYSINEPRRPNPRLWLHFKHGDLYFYACAIKKIEGELDELYDWSADIMSDTWNARKAAKRIKDLPGKTMICDILLNQALFAGSGNIIKTEVLFRANVHPESRIEAIPAKKIAELIRETRKYSFEFLAWKKKGTLKKNWRVYSKKSCPRCKIPLIKKYTGKLERRTFFCKNCQVKYV